MRSAVFPHSLPYSHYRYYRRECGRGLAVRMRSIITGYRNNTEQTERWMCPWTLQWCIQWAAKLSVISCAKHSIPISDCSIDWKIETEPNRVGNRFVDRSNNPFCTGKPSDNCFPRLEYCVFSVWNSGQTSEAHLLHTGPDSTHAAGDSRSDVIITWRHHHMENTVICIVYTLWCFFSELAGRPFSCLNEY